MNLDLEGLARNLYKTGKPNEEILNELTILTGSEAKAKAILDEIEYTEKISNSFIAELVNYTESGVSADLSGLGCRGSGDFLIHHKIAEIIDNQDSIIDPKQQDDAGVIQIDNKYISVTVDGMHSRLSHFPFIAGFHVARAAIRDIIVMGVEPKALFTDIHLANNGDLAKIFDYTAGIAVVSELTNTPLIAGSTLRIGGDLVLGDRLTGCAGCIGYGTKLTPRKHASVGDVLIMTEGSGGGTITTTALYNGYYDIVKETLNLKIINLGKKLLRSKLLENIHTLTDVTNGGIRGDAFEIAKTAQVRITIFENEFKKLINSKVLEMLTKLNIDPLGVSIDSILIILPRQFANDILEFILECGIKASIIGQVESTIKSRPGVQLLKDSFKNQKELSQVEIVDIDKESLIELTPEYREAPYTPIKKVVDLENRNSLRLESLIELAIKNSINKKTKIKNWIITNHQE